MNNRDNVKFTNDYGICANEFIELPEDYKVIDYIRIPAGCWLNTTFKPNSNSSIEIKFSMSSNANSGAFIYGAGVASGDNAFELYPWTYDNKQMLQFNYCNSASFLSTFSYGSGGMGNIQYLQKEIGNIPSNTPLIAYQKRIFLI